MPRFPPHALASEPAITTAVTEAKKLCVVCFLLKIQRRTRKKTIAAAVFFFHSRIFSCSWPPRSSAALLSCCLCEGREARFKLACRKGGEKRAALNERAWRRMKKSDALELTIPHRHPLFSTKNSLPAGPLSPASPSLVPSSSRLRRA